jgi:hypothetical protein
MEGLLLVALKITDVGDGASILIFPYMTFGLSNSSQFEFDAVDAAPSLSLSLSLFLKS